MGGNTDLKGAVIASNQTAIDAGLNRLDTGTLTHSDILNRAEYDATSLSLGFGYSSSGSGVGTDQQGNAQTGAEQTPGSTLPSNGGFSATTPVAMKAGDSDSSTTHSGVSGGVLTIRDADGQGTLANLKRDVNSEQDGSNALKPIFDQQEIETAFEITKAFVQESGAFLQRKSAETASAQQALDEEQKKPAGEQNQARIAELQQTVDDNATWEMGGAGRLLLTALSAGAGGNVTGGTGEMLQATAVNFAQGLAAQGVKLVAGDDDATRALLHGMVGCLGAAGQGGDCGSGALGGSGAVALNLLLDQMQGVNGSELTATEKEARSNLVASLLAGAAAAAGGDAGTVGTAGKLETENNAVWFAAAALSSEALAALGLGAAAGGAAAVALNDEGTQQALQGAGEATASAMDTSLEIWKLLGIALGFPITELGNNSTTSPGENITNLDGTNTEMGQGVRSIYPTIPVVIRLWKMDLGVRSCLWLIRCQD